MAMAVAHGSSAAQGDARGHISPAVAVLLDGWDFALSGPLPVGERASILLRVGSVPPTTQSERDQNFQLRALPCASEAGLSTDHAIYQVDDRAWGDGRFGCRRRLGPGLFNISDHHDIHQHSHSPD